MRVTWTASADKHGIPREETVWAITHADLLIGWPPAREGHTIIPTLAVGPSRFGTLEVLLEVGEGTVVVFHSMRLRPSTQRKIDQQGGQHP